MLGNEFFHGEKSAKTQLDHRPQYFAVCGFYLLKSANVDVEVLNDIVGASYIYVWTVEPMWSISLLKAS